MKHNFKALPIILAAVVLMHSSLSHSFGAMAWFKGNQSEPKAEPESPKRSKPKFDTPKTTPIPKKDSDSNHSTRPILEQEQVYQDFLAKQKATLIRTDSPSLANQLAYRAVRAMGCHNFRDYFYAELYPRLLILQDRSDFGESSFQELVWDYAFRRFKTRGKSFKITSDLLQILLSEKIDKSSSIRPDAEVESTLATTPPGLECGFDSLAPIPTSYKVPPRQMTSTPIVTPPEREEETDNSTDAGIGNIWKEINMDLVMDLADDGFATNNDCRRVFTGNAGNYAYAEESYARTLARSFAQDLCAPITDTLHSTQGLALGHSSDDAFNLDHFASNVQALQNKGADGRIAATYALLYTHALRESNGYFLEGRDVSASNTSLATVETGAYQVSSETLFGPVAGLQDLFYTYVDTLNDVLDFDSAIADVCALNDLDDSRKNKSIQDHKSYIFHLLGVGGFKTGSLAEGDKEFGSCADVVATKGRLVRGDESTARCFIGLQKACPAFAIKYSSMMVRKQRKHYGPLWLHSEFRALGLTAEKYFKPYMKAQCTTIFENILERKADVCRQR